jgi:hypothetical protein
MEVVMKALISILSLLFLFSPVQAAEMSSASFTMEAAGFSSGGGPSAGSSFRTNTTLGQSTPLMLKTYPNSASFRNFPGLRYQLEEYGVLEIKHGFLPSIFQLLLLDED